MKPHHMPANGNKIIASLLVNLTNAVTEMHAVTELFKYVGTCHTKQLYFLQKFALAI